MAEAEDFQVGHCQSGLPSCRGGQRRVREYIDGDRRLLICDHCWPHRKRAPGRRTKKEERA